MSTIARVDEERWLLPLVAAVVIAIVTSVALVKLGPGDATAEQASQPRQISVAAPYQADWEVQMVLVGTLGPVAPREKALLARQGPRVMTLVSNAYDAMFLEPYELRPVLSETFARPAARALRAAGIRLPDDIREVRFVRRSAHVGIDAAGGRSAAVEVIAKVRGRTPTRTITVLHRADLWLERTEGGWRVIAFSVDQEPVR